MSDYCRECKAELKDSDFITEQQKVPYGSTYTYETIVIGYKCGECGYEETY